MFNIENLEITKKYGEGYLILSHLPKKAMVNILLYFLLLLFFLSEYILVHIFLNGPKRGPSWKSHKENSEKCHSPL